jgi:membrane-bound lytic murein transglycosylase D
VIREANNIPPNMVLKAGSTVLVPKTEQMAAKDISPEIADNAMLAIVPEVATRQISVKVGKRDTLYSIAKRHKVSVAQIKDWNNLRQDRIASGQNLQLHVPYRAATRKVSRQVTASKASKRKIAATPAKGKVRKAVTTADKNGKKKSS